MQSLVNLDDKLVFFMLDSEAVSPCYMFRHSTKPYEQLTPDRIQRHLHDLAHTPHSLNMFLLTSDRAVHPSLFPLLSAFPDQIATPPLSRQQQVALGVPRHEQQAVVFRSVKELDQCCQFADGRGVILHVMPHEIGRLSDTLAMAADHLGQVTIRPSAVTDYGDANWSELADEIAAAQLLTYRKTAGGGYLATVNTSLLRSTGGCPARGESVTVGPDGRCYACPAFYYAQQPVEQFSSLVDWAASAADSPRSCTSRPLRNAR
jgi:hypothetical protein